MLEILAEWPLVLADFASEYQIRLAVFGDADMSWREFHALLSGLMWQPDSRIYRRFTQQEEDGHVD